MHKKILRNVQKYFLRLSTGISVKSGACFEKIRFQKQGDDGR